MIPRCWPRELMAAYVSKANQCPFCVSAHSATSTMWYDDQAKVASTLADVDAAPIDEPLRATLRMLGKLTERNSVDADDIRAVLDASVSPQQIKDAWQSRSPSMSPTGSPTHSASPSRVPKP